MPNAFEDSVLDAISNGTTTASGVSHFTAADTLNEANNNGTFIDSAFEVAESIPKFITASLVSGANQLYNIPIDVGNLFGADLERSDTYEVISELDDDLGKFYRENQEAIDLVGFMASSIIPGTAGVKVLKAGQTALRAGINAGKYGKGMGKALGLLAPQKDMLVKSALKEVVSNTSATSLLERNAVKAISAGAGQAFLEGVAFESAVSATMFNSPILENQDLGDIASNIFLNAGIYAGFAGIVDATKLSFALKNTANKAELEARPWKFIPDHPAKSNPYEKIALDYEEINNIPTTYPSGDNILAGQESSLKVAAKDKVRKLNQRIRKNLAEITNGDQDLADNLFESLKSSNKLDQQGAVIGLQEATGFSHKSKFLEKLTRETNKQNPRLKELRSRVDDIKNPLTVKEIDELAALEVETVGDIHTGYVQLSGEDAGKLFVDMPEPMITDLVDTLTKPGQKVVVKGGRVVAGSKKFTFNTMFNEFKQIKGKEVKQRFSLLKSDPFELQARYFWANNLKPFAPKASPVRVNVDDIPLMEKVLKETSEGLYDIKDIKFIGDKGEEFVTGDFIKFLGDKKVELANRLLYEQPSLSQKQIAAMVNVRSSMLDGIVKNNPIGDYHLDDILALQSFRDEYINRVGKQVPLHEVPKTVKLVYDSSELRGINNHVLENMAIIKEQQRLYVQGTRRAASTTLGKFSEELIDIDTPDIKEGAVPSGAGGGLLTAASNNYGTVASFVERAGSTTTRAIEYKKQRLLDLLEPHLYKLGQNKKAAIEWSVLNQRLRGFEGHYGLNEAGDALEPLVLLRYKRALQEAAEQGLQPPKPPKIPKGMDEVIPLNTEEVQQLAAIHIARNGERTSELAGIRTSQGVKFRRDPEAFYPIPVDTSEFKHIAIVKDKTITAGNHHTTLYAADERELQKMISKMKENPDLEVLTKGDAERYYRDIGQWSYEKTISDNYIDFSAKRKGVSAATLPATDPNKIIEDTLNWHVARETGLVREAVSAHYEVAFRELENLGEEYVNAATSTAGGGSALSKAAQAVKGIKNPYKDYIDTALAVKKGSTYPWWVKVNTFADEAFSSIAKRAADLGYRAKTPEELAEVNNMLKEAGYRGVGGAFYDETMDMFANHRGNKNLLSRAVAAANTTLATLVLRWDHMNSVVNAVSANVLLGAEAKSVIRAINRGDSNAVGKLAQIAKIKVPGTDKSILAPRKLIANSIRKFNSLDMSSSPEYQLYKENGFLSRIYDQYRNSVADLAFDGKDAISWNNRISKVRKNLQAAGDIGEKYTANKLAEEFNRFVAADVMKQLTDIAVDSKLMTSKEALSYINTFVNRTQGNYLASQRPMLFQGPVGQAMGLFQTYQFNLMQQLLRYAGEVQAKDALTLLALQGTIHGMNGLPGFQAINTHIVGSYSGNTEHDDIYSSVYGAVGKEAGEWLMYGLASNALGLIDPDMKWAIYTRGDINPRHVTVIPTNPADVPIYAATAKFMGNIFNTVSSLKNGGDVAEVLLQGLEHNGISRPLAGLAQTLQGIADPNHMAYSTSSRGNVVYANDLVSWANLGRMLGSKPLDEAVALDTAFRVKAYALKDQAKKNALGRAIKSKLIGGGELTGEELENFAYQYAKIGGKQREFASWIGSLYKTANTSQTNKIKETLSNSYSQNMQLIMGGEDIEDFSGL